MRETDREDEEEEEGEEVEEEEEEEEGRETEERCVCNNAIFCSCIDLVLQLVEVRVGVEQVGGFEKDEEKR